MPTEKSVADVKVELESVLASELAARKFSYTRSDGTAWTLALQRCARPRTKSRDGVQPERLRRAQMGRAGQERGGVDLQAACTVGAAREDGGVPGLVPRATPTAACRRLRSGRFGREMTQRATFYVYVLLLLICSSVAAKPINKPAKTATVHPPAAPKETQTTPSGPANVLFGSAASPAPLAARAIGFYARGCLAGGVSLPISGPNWQVMRPSRNRNWGHPRLLDFLERLANDARTLDGWPGLLSATCRSPAEGRWSPVIRAIRSGLTLIFG